VEIYRSDGYADIPNAVLSLPGENEFQSIDPVAEIARVTVSNLPDNRVRLAIRGLAAPPTAEVRTDAQALIVSVSTVEPDEAEQAEVEDAIQILITAEKIPDEPQDVPISLTVLTEKQLEDAHRLIP